MSAAAGKPDGQHRRHERFADAALAADDGDDLVYMTEPVRGFEQAGFVSGCTIRLTGGAIVRAFSLVWHKEHLLSEIEILISVPQIEL